MEFFKKIFPLMDGIEKTTITIQKKGDKLIVGFLPQVKNGEVNDKLRLTSVTGAPEDLDNEFFDSVGRVNEAIKGAVTNVEEVNNELKELEKEKKADAEKKKAKPEEKKKAAPAAKKSTPNANKVANDAKAEKNKPEAEEDNEEESAQEQLKF